MMKGRLTREQVVKMFGEEIINKLESMNCEPTNRLQTDGDDSTEYSAVIDVNHPDYNYVVAYYYTTPEQEQKMADNDGDGSAIDWEIDGYNVG